MDKDELIYMVETYNTAMQAHCETLGGWDYERYDERAAFRAANTLEALVKANGVVCRTESVQQTDGRYYPVIRFVWQWL